MKLISDIVNELVDTKTSITSPLLKTKVLASRLKNNDLLDWVNRELNGYDELGTLPNYRKAMGQISGTYINGNFKYTNQPIPTFGLADDMIEALHSMDFYQSVSTLESYLGQNESGKLEQIFPAELAAYLESNIRKNGNRFFHLVSAHKFISINSVTQVISVIRSKLLDFMLKLDEEFGNIAEIEDLRHKNESITKYMSQTIITTGDGNILNTGDQAQIKARIKINKGDKEALKKKLKENSIEDNDIAELIQIVDTEEPDTEKATFGKKANGWIQKMIGKSLDGTWQISVGAAGSLLAEVIRAYYGF